MDRRLFLAGGAGWWCTICSEALAQTERFRDNSVVQEPPRQTELQRNRDISVHERQPALRPVTGKWCGAADPRAGADGVRPRVYGLKATGWRGKSDFTWSFSGTVLGVGGAPSVIPLLNQAFNLWAKAAPLLRFRRVDSGGDIVIGVGVLSNPNFLAFTTTDGRSITLQQGATFRPTTVAQPTARVPGLLGVAAHEIGHALGLLHSTLNASIMFPSANTQETLGDDDENAIRALYGWPGQRRLPFGTEQGPAMCVCGGTLAMVWRGQSDDRNIYISTSADGRNWAPQRLFRDISTIGSPTLGWDGSNLWMVWRGTGPDQQLWFKRSTDFFMRDNPPQRVVPNVLSSHGPRMAVIRGIPTVVWKGMNADQRIYMTEFRGGTWQSQEPLPGIFTNASPAICEDLGGGIRLLWRGAGSDERLWTTFAPPDSHNFAPQSLLRWPILGNSSIIPIGFGTAYSAVGPALAVLRSQASFTVPADVRIYAAWRGPTGNQGLFLTQLNSDGWSTQANIPNVGSSQSPALAIFGDQLHLAWKGIKDDPGLYKIDTT